MAEQGQSRSLEYTPTWVVAVVCSIIVLISLCAERGLHRLGKCLKHKNQDALYEALQKLKEELMLLGFISLLLTVSQSAVSHICIPTHLASNMLPCKADGSVSLNGSDHELYSYQGLKNRRRLFSTDVGADHCSHKGKVPLLSLEGLHQLHIFIFVLAVVHVLFCATTMVLGGAKIRQWKQWENSTRSEISKPDNASSTSRIPMNNIQAHHHRQFFKERGIGYWRKSAIVSWMMSFFKQFYASVTKSDYIALRQGFIMAHCPTNPRFDFHKYMMRTLGVDYKRIVGISWYLWLFVVFFLLLNVEGWHTYFWLAFLPLILLLLVGAKLEHIITRLAQEIGERNIDIDNEAPGVKPSDEHFWFDRPRIILYLIHFILFQNSFEIAFFFWIWYIWIPFMHHGESRIYRAKTYNGVKGDSSIEQVPFYKTGIYLLYGFCSLIVQVLCSYSTLPLYVIVTQMGDMFKQGIFDEQVHGYIQDWAQGRRWKGKSSKNRTTKEHKLAKQSFQDDVLVAAEQPTDGVTISVTAASFPSS